MDQSKNLSALLSQADTLEAAMKILVRNLPDLPLETLFSAERAEILEAGWSPSRHHRDCAHLVSLTEILRPLAQENGSLSIAEAFAILRDSKNPHAREFARALDDL